MTGGYQLILRSKSSEEDEKKKKVHDTKGSWP